MADLPLPEQGDIWLNKDTIALKYHLENKNYTVIPQDWFTAGENIDKPGYVVSLIDDGKVYKTDTAIVGKTIGINITVATADSPIEIQRAGLYHYNDTDWPVAPFTLSQIGQIAYVAIAPDGQITTDRNAAVLGNNNLIEIGQIVSERDLMIAIEGDGRGPIDYSEIEFTTGEEIDISGTPKLVSLRSDGKVYLSSKRTIEDRYNVVGFIVGSIIGIGVVPPDTKVVVRKLGKVEGFTGLTPGLPVFCGGDSNSSSFGIVTQNQASISPYYDHYINIGIAKSDTKIITNIQPAYNVPDVSPIGSITITDPIKTEPDTGNLWMNGQVLNAVTNPEYQALYDVVGNIWGGTNNTNFVLKNLNVAESKYQIKYKYFYQFQPIYTPVYRVEFPNETWRNFDGLDFLVDVYTLEIDSEEDLKEINVSIIAKKNDKTVIVPDLFVYNDGIQNNFYGYSITYVSTASVRVNFAEHGLAYVDNGVVTELDSTWDIKVIVQKHERLNRYRDTDADFKLNTLWTDKNNYNTIITFEDLTQSKAYGILNKNYSVTMTSNNPTTVNIQNGGSIGKSFTLTNFGSGICTLNLGGSTLIALTQNASVTYIWNGSLWRINNSVTYVSDWNSHRTYKLFEPTFFNGVPYRSKQNNNTNQNPETALDWWEVTGGGGVTINGTSNVTVPNNTVLALDTNGKFIVADKRYNTTCIAVGFAKGPQTINIDGQILGNGSIVKGFTSLIPGKSVFLANSGGVLQDESNLVPGDYRVHLGIALNTTDLVVAIYEPLLMTVGGTNTLDGVGIEAFWPANLSAPGGWLKEDGSAISRTIYSDLFSIIGTTYGIGDGSTTFNLPTVPGGIIRYIPWTTLGGVDQVTIDKVQKLEDFREWKAGETYALNEPVFYNGVPYRSLIESNFGNIPDSSPAAWEVTGGGGGSGENYLVGDLTKLKVGVTDVGVTSTWNSAYTNILNTGALQVTVGASGTNRYIDLNIKDLDRNEVGQPWYVKFSYILGTNADDLVSVVLFDGTNEIPTAIGLLPYAGGTLQVTGGAVLPNNVLVGNKLRFKFKNNTAITFYVADVSVGPQNVLAGAAVGATQTYPLTIGATTTAPTKGTVITDIATWTRKGDRMVLFYAYEQSTGGNAGSGTYVFPLPSGYSIDLLRVPIGSTVGTCKVLAPTISEAIGVVVVEGASLLRMQYVAPTGAEVTIPVGSSGYGLTGARRYGYVAEVPIAQWTSNVNLASDFQEFAYNTSTTTTTDTTSFGYGPEGALIRAFTSTIPSFTVTTKRIRFKIPIQKTDIIICELFRPDLGQWIDVTNDQFVKTSSASQSKYGIELVPVAGSQTDIDVNFGGMGRASEGATYGSAGSTWNEMAVINYRWRVRKISNGNMAEQPESIKPIGEITMFGGTTAPHGWLLCDGAAISRSAYPRLFSVIGTNWGAGDGSTTFNLPDMRGAAPAGVGTSTGYTQNETLALGTKYNDQTQGHGHGAQDAFGVTSTGGAAALTAGSGLAPLLRNIVTDGTNGTPRIGNVTRGKVVGVNFIIRWM